MSDHRPPVLSLVCGVQGAVCGVQGAVCVVRGAVCVVRCAVCGVRGCLHMSATLVQAQRSVIVTAATIWRGVENMHKSAKATPDVSTLRPLLMSFCSPPSPTRHHQICQEYQTVRRISKYRRALPDPTRLTSVK